MKYKQRTPVAVFLGVVLIFSMVGMITIAEASDGVIYVPAPTGIPETDWYNIQTALDNAMPGDMIVLAAGDYYVHQPLVKDGFSGILKGAGKDVTTIEVSKASDGALFPAIRIEAWDGWEEFSVPAGWQFFTTTLAYFGACESAVISDLTMIMDGEDLTEYSYLYHPATELKVYILEEEWGRNIAYAFIVDIAEGCDTTLERVGLIGANDGTVFQPVSPNHGFYITSALLSGDDDCGTHTVRDCDFIGLGSNAYQPIGLGNGEIVVESCVFRDSCSGVVPVFCDRMDITVTNCLFQNMFHAGVRLIGVSGHVADISHNTMIDSGGVWVGAIEPINPFTYLPYEKCYLNIQHNDMNLRQYGEWAGLEIWNYIDEDNWADLVFKNNKIHSEDAWLFGPIFTVNAHYAEITNNIITGSGPAAMYIGVADWEGANDRGVYLQGNNVELWEVDGGPWEPYWHGVAPIWLGYTTSQCKVISNPANVFDETDDPSTPEYDGNNFLTGVNL